MLDMKVSVSRVCNSLPTHVIERQIFMDAIVHSER